MTAYPAPLVDLHTFQYKTGIEAITEFVMQVTPDHKPRRRPCSHYIFLGNTVIGKREKHHVQRSPEAIITMGQRQITH